MTSKRKLPAKPRPSRRRDCTAAWIVGPALGAAVTFVICVLAYTFGGRPW